MSYPKKKSRRKKAGLAPGSVVFTGNQHVDQIFIHYTLYDQKTLKDETLDNLQELVFHHSKDDQVDWYDIRGLHDTALIESLGSTFEIHSLILEDVANTQQRPKFEEYERGNFIVVRALGFDKENVQIKTEQVSIYFKKGLLLSFQETGTDLFASIRERIKSGRARIRSRGSDFLAYALLDNIVDNYYFVLDAFEDEVEKLEEKILTDPDETIRQKAHHLKRELLVVRKSIAPLREAISKFAKSESEFIDDTSGLFVRDLYDHTVQIMDLVENYRDSISGLQDLYLSEISFKMNQVMQVLTVITTIFVPISFLAGLYGMNFVNIPELQSPYGYFILLAVMAIIAIGSLLYFKKKKWF